MNTVSDLNIITNDVSMESNQNKLITIKQKIFSLLLEALVGKEF